jgi:prefoldin alpha subunit
MVAAYQQYEAEAGAIVRQLGVTQVTLEDLDKAILSLEALEGALEDQEMMVSIGSGSFLHARLSSKDKVVINVGAGVSLEKTRGDAIETLKARRTDISAGSKRLNDVLAKLEGEMSRIQAALQQYQGTEGSEAVVQ